MEQDQFETFTPEDIEKNKLFAALAYILFFIPLLLCPDSKFGKFHANQGLLLFILGVANWAIGVIIPILGFIISGVLSIAIVILAIIGIINAINGEAKPLPIIGKYRLLK